MTHDMKMNLQGLVGLLAHHLYSEPDVFLRELVQNAHDAILKRELSAGAGYSGSLSVVSDPMEGRLSFEDNGIGLNEEEIHRLLSTLGESDKGAFNRELAAEPGSSPRRMIGQFGIGLLSCFIVAVEVEVLTRKEGCPGLRWRSQGGLQYQLEPAERPGVGTTVTLTLRPDQQRYLNDTYLTVKLRHFADLIPLPIHVNRGAEPVNRGQAPWHQDENPATAYERFWQERCPDRRSLASTPLDLCYTVPAADGCGERQGRVRGVLVIEESSGHPRSGLDLYLSRMFVAGGLKTLLPEWACFVSGVIESSDLVPNSARDNVMAGPELTALRTALGTRILQWLQQLAAVQPGVFAAIVKRHAERLLDTAARVDDDRFLLAVAPLLPLPTNLAPLSLAGYLGGAGSPAGARRLLYWRQALESGQFRNLAAARGLTVFDARPPRVWQLLRRYAALPQVELALEELRPDGELIFMPLDSREEQHVRPLAEFLARQLALDVLPCRFEPSEIPLAVTELSGQCGPSGNEALPGYLAEMADWLEPETTSRPRAYVNLSCPLVLQIDRLREEDPPLAALLARGILNSALILHADELSPSAVREMFAFNNLMLNTLLQRLFDVQCSPEGERIPSAAIASCRSGGSVH